MRAAQDNDAGEHWRGPWGAPWRGGFGGGLDDVLGAAHGVLSAMDYNDVDDRLFDVQGAQLPHPARDPAHARRG